MIRKSCLKTKLILIKEQNVINIGIVDHKFSWILVRELAN